MTCDDRERPTKPETWDSLLAERSADIQAAAQAMVGVLMAELPGSIFHFDRGDGLLAVGGSGSRRDLLFALIPHTRWVNLQLADGAQLPDPTGLIEGTGKRIRHVKIRSADAWGALGEAADVPLLKIRSAEVAGSAAVRAIVQAQVAHGG